MKELYKYHPVDRDSKVINKATTEVNEVPPMVCKIITDNIFIYVQIR